MTYGNVPSKFKRFFTRVVIGPDDTVFRAGVVMWECRTCGVKITCHSLAAAAHLAKWHGPAQEAGREA